MVRRRVQRVEAMIFVFDFRTVGDGETDLAKAADDVLGDLRERMQLAEGAAAAGQSEIGRFLGQRGFQFEFCAALGQGGFEFHFGLIDELCRRRAFPPWQACRAVSSAR